MSSLPIPVESNVGGAAVTVHDGVPGDEARGDQKSGGLWSRLWHALVGLLAPRARHRQVAEDVASETVLRVWRRLGDGAPWKELWSLGVRIARNLLMNCLRALRLRRELTDHVDVEVVADKLHSIVEPLDLQGRLSRLRLRLPVAERQTLDLLEAGILTTRDLATARGVGERAARKSLARLRAAAGSLMESLPTGSVLWSTSVVP